MHGVKIKNAIKKAGLTQQKLARKIGVKQAQISGWVIGKRVPKLSSLKKIAIATGKPLSYFFDDMSVNGNINVDGSNTGIVGHNSRGRILVNKSLEEYRTILIERLEKIENDIKILSLKLELLLERSKKNG
jgi:transcriptional regulator with XRE-family HTH domain